MLSNLETVDRSLVATVPLIVGFLIDSTLELSWGDTLRGLVALTSLSSCWLIYNRYDKLPVTSKLYMSISSRFFITCVTWTFIYRYVGTDKMREVTSTFGTYRFWLSFVLRECTEFFYAPLLREPIVEYLLNDKFLDTTSKLLEVVSLKSDSLLTYILISTTSFLNGRLIFLDTYSLINLIDFINYLLVNDLSNLTINLKEWAILILVIFLTLTGGRLRLSVPWSEVNEQTREVTSINISNWRKLLQGSYHVIDLLNNDQFNLGLYGKTLLVMFYFLIKLMPFKSLLHDLRIKKVMVNERHIGWDIYLECTLRCALIALLWAYMLRTVNSESTMIILRFFYIFLPVWDLLTFLRASNKMASKMEVRFSEILRNVWVNNVYV